MPTADEIRMAIEQLAQALGVAAEYVWEVMYRQELVVGGWMALAICVVWVLVGVNFLHRGRASWRRTNDIDECLGWFVGGGGLLVIASMYAFVEALPRIINPGYYVIKSIAGLF